MSGLHRPTVEYLRGIEARHPHGVRLRYQAGCRCDECRAANTAFRRKQREAWARGERDRTVSAERARLHMVELSGHGVGRKAVCLASSIAMDVINAVKSGRKTRIRQSTERAILSVTPAALMDGAKLPADQSKALIRELREEGFTVKQLAQRLGYRTRHFDIGRQITLRQADRIARLHRALTSEALIPASFGKPRRRAQQVAR